MAGDSRRANWRSKRRCDYYQRRRLTFRVLALDSRVQEIMINGDIEERLPTRTIRDMITCFADRFSQRWWETIVVYQDGEEIMWLQVSQPISMGAHSYSSRLLWHLMLKCNVGEPWGSMVSLAPMASWSSSRLEELRIWLIKEELPRERSTKDLLGQRSEPGQWRRRWYQPPVHFKLCMTS